LKTVLVTGASKGIGRAVCKYLVEKEYNVFGSVRKNQEGQLLKSQLGAKFIPLNFDVTKPEQVDASKKIISDYLNGHTLTALINNAGIATMGPIQYLNVEKFKSQIDVKLIGSLICTQAFLPFLGTNKKNNGPKGRIINISSILGGKIGVPFLSAYCASKHALEGFSESLRRELIIHGIKVVIVAPGTVETPLWDIVSDEKKEQSYQNTEYRLSFEKSLSSLNTVNKKTLPMQKLCKVIQTAIETKNPKVRYSVTADPFQKIWHLIPKRIVDKLFQIGYGIKRSDIN